MVDGSRSAERNDLDDSALLFAPAGEVTHADPSTHTRLPAALRTELGVTQGRTNLEPIVRAEVSALLDSLRDGAKVDFAEDLASPVPARRSALGWASRVLFMPN